MSWGKVVALIGGAATSTGATAIGVYEMTANVVLAFLIALLVSLLWMALGGLAICQPVLLVRAQQAPQLRWVKDHGRVMKKIVAAAVGGPSRKAEIAKRKRADALKVMQQEWFSPTSVGETLAARNEPSQTSQNATRHNSVTAREAVTDLERRRAVGDGTSQGPSGIS